MKKVLLSFVIFLAGLQIWTTCTAEKSKSGFGANDVELFLIESTMLQ